MCARGELDLRVPERVGTLLDEAIRAVRAVEGRWMPPGEALEKVAEHFVETWEPLLRERRTRRRRVMERDQGFCQVPGCSRRAAHVHHVRHRSQAGGDEDENLISTCVAHHLFGIHHGYIRVTGRAPEALVWEVALLDG